MKQIHALFVALSIITFTFIFTACVPETTVSTPADSTAPVITEVTPVTTPSTDYTPEYTFNTDEAGTISYGGGCSSDTTAAVVGNNTISFSPLIDGDYSCTITVTDAAGNASNELAVTGFEVTVGLIKLDVTGAALADQSQAWNDSGDESTFDQWSCVYDNRTGNTWEVKQDSGAGDRSLGVKYAWYDSSLPVAQQGQSFGTGCSFTPNCNTEAYVTAINALNLCGYSDWRLPMISELISLSGSATLPDFFYGLSLGSYWTSETVLGMDAFVWAVNPGIDHDNLSVSSGQKAGVTAMAMLIRK